MNPLDASIQVIQANKYKLPLSRSEVSEIFPATVWTFENADIDQDNRYTDFRIKHSGDKFYYSILASSLLDSKTLKAYTNQGKGIKYTKHPDFYEDDCVNSGTNIPLWDEPKKVKGNGLEHYVGKAIRGYTQVGELSFLTKSVQAIGESLCMAIVQIDRKHGAYLSGSKLFMYYKGDEIRINLKTMEVKELEHSNYGSNWIEATRKAGILSLLNGSTKMEVA